MLAHGTKSREAWLWHRRLGHPSAGHLHLLLPELFPSNCTLDCETCALAKSHKNLSNQVTLGSVNLFH
ncbi:putative GAG-pre-integrase domain-containing protein [Helianthus debilis subsp. tardiflorus]